MFYSGKCANGVSEQCDTTPCAPRVAPSLWTFWTTEPFCDSDCSRDHDAHGSPARCCAPARHSRQLPAQTPLRFFKVAPGSETSGTKLVSLRTTDASTQESSNNDTSCTSWFSFAAHTRRRAHKSATPSCPRPIGVPSRQSPAASLGLLPVLHTRGTGCACVLVKSAVPETRSNMLFWSRQQVFVGHSGWCANAMEKNEKAGQQTLSAASEEGSLECSAATCPGFRKKTTTRLL